MLLYRLFHFVYCEHVSKVETDKNQASPYWHFLANPKCQTCKLAQIHIHTILILCDDIAKKKVISKQCHVWIFHAFYNNSTPDQNTCMISAAHCLLSYASCLTPYTANCPLPAAHWRLPTAFCPLPYASFLMPLSSSLTPYASRLPSAHCQLPTALPPFSKPSIRSFSSIKFKQKPALF